MSGFEFIKKEIERIRTECLAIEGFEPIYSINEMLELVNNIEKKYINTNISRD